MTGTIISLEDSRFVLKTRSGEAKQVDASEALEARVAPPLVVGKAFTVLGTVDSSGALHAQTILRAVASPAQWPADH